ncbi:hypothetical protein EZV73_23610 [Acidaminobacter sp. JC074]|uniref:hypothetical protein n=1 Tax=Acidaminobacter sp. JC074 TaxID=2530199 RepID=UPI001F0CE626|nr:hypothetical protein [Acidaminobacter sp. JC074]MCH4890589.1 hypothetical protein [Acidaminobacter sp. JC074]
MKNAKKTKISFIVIVCVFLVLFIFTEERYIFNNIERIDKADSIKLIYNDKEVMLSFDDHTIDILSYGGSIVKVDSIFKSLVNPYRKELEKTDFRVEYFKEHSKLAHAEIYTSKDFPDEYIMYMNHVYWRTRTNIEVLYKMINN